MSKRLKRRIQEECGLSSLGKEERTRRVHEILDSTDEKQAICNKIAGVSFKDIEKALKDLISNKRSKEEQTRVELEEEVPYKLHPEMEVKSRPATANSLVPLLDQAEVNRLVNESVTSKATEQAAPVAPESYLTYSFEEVAALMACNYHPSMFKSRR